MIAITEGAGGAYKAPIFARNVGIICMSISWSVCIAGSKLVCDVGAIDCEKMKAAPVRDGAVLEKEGFDGEGEDIGSGRISRDERMYLYSEERDKSKAESKRWVSKKNSKKMCNIVIKIE